jgi:hypothetical protein
MPGKDLEELRSRQAPNLAAFGYEKAEPARAANRDLTAKIESAPGSGLRKRLAAAERLVGHPGELGKRQAELEKIQQQIAEATAQRNAVLAAARKDPTGASIIKDMQAELEQYRGDCVAAEHAHDDIKGKYQTLAAAVCPFPKEHDKLVKQAAAARDRALIECSAALPDGYRLEHATPDGGPCGYRWTTRVDTWGETLDSPGVAVRQAWQRLVGQQQTAHREAVRHAERAAANAAKVEHLEAQLAGKGSAADHVRAGWETGTTKYGRPGQPLIGTGGAHSRLRLPASAWSHPGVLALTISAPDALAGMVAKPSRRALVQAFPRHRQAHRRASRSRRSA